jgi:hypothetical protein
MNLDTASTCIACFLIVRCVHAKLPSSWAGVARVLQEVTRAHVDMAGFASNEQRIA